MLQKIEKTVLCQQINDHNIENVNRSGEVYISNTATRYNYHRTRSHCLIELHQQSTKGFNIFCQDQAPPPSSRLPKIKEASG